MRICRGTYRYKFMYRYLFSERKGLSLASYLSDPTVQAPLHLLTNIASLAWVPTDKNMSNNILSTQPQSLMMLNKRL